MIIETYRGIDIYKDGDKYYFSIGDKKFQQINDTEKYALFLAKITIDDEIKKYEKNSHQNSRRNKQRETAS